VKRDLFLAKPHVLGIKKERLLPLFLNEGYRVRTYDFFSFAGIFSSSLHYLYPFVLLKT
jgi:hypothetical protein